MAETNDEKQYASFSKYALDILSPGNDVQKFETQNEQTAWKANSHLLTKLIKEKRDTIWIYVLQNISRPLVLRHRKFDIVAGNPPWIAYRYIRDQTYQKEIKKLVREYNLLAPDQKN